MGFSYIALRRPISARWYAMRPMSHLFGFSAVVLRYNTMGRLFPAIAARILCIPTISHFGDFGFSTKSVVDRLSLQASNSTARLLGIILAGREAEIDKEIVYLWILGGFLLFRMGGSR